MAEEKNQSFAWEAISPSGKRESGKMVAPSDQAVLAALADDGWTPVSVKPARGLAAMSTMSFGGERAFKLDDAGLAAFSRQLNQLLKAGIAVPRALATMGEERDPAMERVCNTLSERVGAGVPLSRAFAEFPEAFDDVFCSYIASGEQSGRLVETTSRLASMLDKKSGLRLKVKSVTAYPKFVAIAIGLIVLGILMYLVPKYAEIYDSFGAKLPGPTQALVTLSSILSPIHLQFKFGFPPIWKQPNHTLLTSPLNFMSPVLWVMLGLSFFRRWLAATRDDLVIGTKLDKIRFRLPLLGQLNKRMMLFRWSSTLAGALSSGLQTYVSLELAANATGSRWMRAVTLELQDAVRSGRMLSSELSNYKDLFPVHLRAMISTGEQSGDLAGMLDNVARTIDEEIDAIVAGLGAKIEVALLAVMGVVVGGLLIVLYMPIMNLSSTVGNGLSGEGGPEF